MNPSSHGPLQRNRAAVRRFDRAMRFGAWLQGLPDRLTSPPFRLMQIGSAFWHSRCLYIAARLDIATVLAERPLPVESLAAAVSARPDALFRILRMLAALGVFEETSPRVFANNRLSSPLRDDAPDSVRAMILLHNSPEMARPWFEQTEACLRDGGVPFERTHGAGLYAYMDAHPDFDALFSAAMDSVEALAGDSFVHDFDWGRFRRVIDVGGSKGSKAIALLRRHPHLTALVVDRPGLIDAAQARRDGTDDTVVRNRLRFAHGDVFDTLPPARDATDIYLLSALLHGFDDEACTIALRTLADACGQSGAHVVLLETVLEPSGVDQARAAFDMQMWMGTRGRERTLDEWSALFGRSGMRLVERVRLRSFADLLVLRRVDQHDSRS